MFEGPEEELVLSENAQPVIMAVSVAIMRVLEKETGLRLENMAAAQQVTLLRIFWLMPQPGLFS